MAQASHDGMLTVSGQPVSPSIHLIKSAENVKNGAGGGVRTHALMEEGRETLGETV
jgi:hypothetical protein